MIEIGKYAKLTVYKQVRMGYLLNNKQGEEVLLPNSFIPENIEPGDKLNVFVYKNSRNEVVATTQEPNITLNKFAFLEVKSNTEHGTFLDWGLDKDLFVPFREQINKMKEGEKYLVYLFFDKKSERLAASTKSNKFIESSNIKLKTGKKITILINEKKDLGYSVIVENKYKGMIYDNEIFRKVKPGDKMNAFVKNVREDGKVDVSLQQLGYKHISTDAEKIAEKLEQNNGKLLLNDKSEPEEIQNTLHMSKKAFKRAIGNLYEKKIIVIKEDGIYLKPIINKATNHESQITDSKL